MNSPLTKTIKKPENPINHIIFDIGEKGKDYMFFLDSHCYEFLKNNADSYYSYVSTKRIFFKWKSDDGGYKGASLVLQSICGGYWHLIQSITAEGTYSYFFDKPIPPVQTCFITMTD